MSNSKWRKVESTKRYQDGELVAADLSAIWNAEKRKPLSAFWPRVGKRFAVLPPTFIDDLMKHHADEGPSYLQDFLTAVGQPERTLIGRWDFGRGEMKLDGLAGLVVVPEWTADIVAVQQHNDSMVNEFRKTAERVFSLRQPLQHALSPEEISALRAIRNQSDPLTSIQIADASKAIGAWINTGSRSPNFGLKNPFDQAVELVMATAALRSIDELSTRGDRVQNDLFDLHYVVLGLLVGDLITNDKRLWNTFLVAKETPKYLVPENTLQLYEEVPKT